MIQFSFAPKILSGNGYYYLIHKWGKEFNSIRRLLVLPFKNIDNLTIFSILVSVVFAFIGKSH